MQLEHLTSSELIEKFSNVANYTVLFCELKYFLYDFTLFLGSVLFGLSGLIGVYFWRKGDQTTPEETLLGNITISHHSS